MGARLPLSDSLRCGLVLAALDGGTARRRARRAEALGFDSLWVGDHLSFYTPILESLTFLGFAAGCTERIRLGTAVYLLPLRSPVVAAKTVATLDVLSGGRFTFGVGIGGEFRPEFEAAGVPVSERGSRTDESIGLLRRLWTEDGVRHAGRHFRFGPISLDPKPVQPGGPPVWVGGRAPAAMRRAGRLGDGYISHMTSPERYRSNLEEIARHRDARDEHPFGSGAFLFTCLKERYEDAHAQAAALLGRLYNRPFEEAARKYCLLGRAEDCLESMRGFVEVGVRDFVLAPLSDPDEFAEQVGREILPALPSLR